jgi:hypothetical protein
MTTVCCELTAAMARLAMSPTASNGIEGRDATDKLGVAVSGCASEAGGRSGHSPSLGLTCLGCRKIVRSKSSMAAAVNSLT